MAGDVGVDMSLRLDGHFWAPRIRKDFVADIESTRSAVVEHMIPSLPSPEREGEKAQAEAWQAVLSTPSDGSDDPADLAEWAFEQGAEVYMRWVSIRQAAVNIACVLLWHVLEQQMLFFHIRQVLTIGEEQGVRSDKDERKRLFSLTEFHRRLNEGGCSMQALLAWPKIDELQLVANSVKHGLGRSLDRLHALRPDLLIPPGIDDLEINMDRSPSWVEKPAVGEDLYVRDEDLRAYFEAAKELWVQFAEAVEQHTVRHRGATI